MARQGVSLGTALARGIRRKCPCCGEASAFRSYLKVIDTCPVCRTPLSIYPTDDGPAYLTILLIGHIVVGPTFLFPYVWTYPVQYVAPILVIVFGVLTLITLPFVKGAFLNLMWFIGFKQAR